MDAKKREWERWGKGYRLEGEFYTKIAKGREGGKG